MAMHIHDTIERSSKSAGQTHSVLKPGHLPSKAVVAAHVGAGPALKHDFSRFSIWHGGDETGVTTPTPAEPATETETTTPESTITTPSTTESTSTTTDTVTGAPATPALSWEYVKRHKWDALWWFNGERPSGFSVTARLQASGYGDPANLNWQIISGADKVGFQGSPTGAEVVLESKKGSSHQNDVEIEVHEGAAGSPGYTGQLTVRQPYRLILRSTNDNDACPAWAGCSAACTAYWTTIDYRIVDNVSGTIVGATVNENFPGAKTSDQPNNWGNPAAFVTTPFWENTNGTFIDNWFVSCGNPAPVAHAAANANTGVDRIPHEFYVGSKTPGRGVRVQTHTAHRYLGFARHENITTPAP